MDKKFIIGLTGNIATGKSLVMRMLKELGAVTIDADKLVHLLMRQGNPLYARVVREFGRYILDDNQEIDRVKLGGFVFSDPGAMAHLEQITHPTVKQVVARLIDNAKSHVVVVEAIKLIESGMAEDYDSVWVVTAPREVQLARMVNKRRLSVADAEQRIDAQPPQADKISCADVVIDNGGDIAGTWKAVQRAFASIPSAAASPAPETAAVEKPETVTVRRARREDVARLTEMLAGDGQAADEAQVLEWFFSKGFFVAVANDTPVAAASLRTENLVAIVDDFAVTAADSWPTVGQALLDSVEKESRQLSCEVSLLFLAPNAGEPALAFFEKNGYERKGAEDLSKMWREAVQDRPAGTELLFVKQLLDHRIVTPI